MTHGANIQALTNHYVASAETLVVDDQASVLEGLLLLIGMLPGIRAVGSGRIAAAALRKAWTL